MQYDIFGCRVNKYFLNQRLGYFAHTGEDHDDDYLIATCEVTDRAKQKRLKRVRQKAVQGCNIFITGCGVLQKGMLISDDEFYRIYPELLPYKSQITLLGERPEGVVSSEYGVSNISTKKYVVIQKGCDNYCSFCLTVQKRGRHESRSAKDIIDEIKAFENAGGKEIVLTGINLAARGCKDSMRPQESSFSALLRKILKQTTIPRIRISSLGPEYLDDSFFAAIRDTRILPHFHLSIQSFSDHVLQLMKRNYDTKVLDMVLQRFQQLDRPDKELFSLGADIIVGFPGETKTDFQSTLDGVRKYQINKLHVFPFSVHGKGQTVPASILPDQIPDKTKKERAFRLNILGDEIRQSFLQRNIGKHHEVMFEECKEGKRYGRTENYIKVSLEGKYKRGDIVKIVL